MTSKNEMLSLDTDVENYLDSAEPEVTDEVEEDVVFTIPVPVVNLTKNLESGNWELTMTAEELHGLYHHIRDFIIYGEGN